MAACNPFLSEEQLQCSICLEIFTKPVSTQCGHNYCMVCVNKYWDNCQKYNCPFCKKEFIERPELCVNTFISDLAAQFKESVKVGSSVHTKKHHAAQGDVPCDVCTDPTQEALKSCLDCGMSFCETHLEHHKIAAKLKQHRLIDAVKNLVDRICQRHQRPLELFCRNEQKCVCLFCTEGEHKSHNTVPIEEESAEKKTKIQKTQADVQKMIQDRLKKIEEIKHSVALQKKNIDKEKDDSGEIFRSLLSSVERMQADLLMVLEEKQKDIEGRAEGFVKALEQEIAALKRSDAELEKLLHCEDHLHLLQAYLTLSTPMSIVNWDQIQIISRLSVEDVMRELLHLQQSVSNTIEKMSGLINLDYQKEEIKRLSKTKLHKGDTWYLVDSGWFKNWKKYVGFEIWDCICKGHETFYPGPVDNSGLLTDSLCMKENLIEELHYTLLPKEAWGKLISWYGLTEHQKPIARKVVEQGVFVKHCKVEVYLTELRLCEFSNMDQSIGRHFSKTDTVACIEKEMHKIFNIPDGKETRLWRKYMHNAFECLGQPGSSIEAAGFFQGQVVVIEQRNEDGTWPRSTVRPTLPKISNKYYPSGAFR
ncbi:hypothetical protein AMELA_G00064080 [Ameiurus melas]|uniref:ubiquitinyl hydrolase 1 n=1 Tax=Ameiurus melas TaxID=219545 RepID=A0A7J6B668_AMEME|nr:hypothetical protein AMELA_G00064080 [Ameiurus melas]